MISITLYFEGVEIVAYMVIICGMWFSKLS